LALCDRRTVKSDDWEPVDKVHEDWIEEGMYLRRRSDHEWYWLSNQTHEEMVAFVVWDSLRKDLTGLFPIFTFYRSWMLIICLFLASTPHCAFLLPNAKSAKHPRESLELRFFLWEKLA
jgi:hypothetical protein